MDGNEMTLEQRGTDRRRARAHLHYPERRSGFDRRTRAWITRVLRDQPVVLIGVLVAINVLSIADWMLTMRALDAGAAEGNPLLAAMITGNPAAAFFFKLLATLGVTFALWSWRRYRAVLVTAIAALTIYAGLMAYHAWGLYQLALV